MNIGVAGFINPMEFKDYLPGENLFEDNTLATAVNTLVKEFLRKGHNVFVFSSCSKGKDEYHFVGDKLQIHMVGMLPSIRFTGRLSPFYMASRIRSLIYPYIGNLDIIHSHWTYYYALASKSFKEQVPLVCTVRDWAPYIYSIQKDFDSRFTWWVNLRVFKRVMKGDDIHFIANSDYTYQRIISAYPNKKISLIYNPVDKLFIIDKRRDNNNNGTTFITISQDIDDYRKNIISLVKAFEMYYNYNPNSRLVIVGNYRQNSPLLKYIQSNRIRNIDLTGQLTHDNVISKIDESTCLVHPAYEETFGNILIEAMARKVPCIGGETAGGVPIVLGNGKYGSVCDISNPKSIFDEMIKFDDSSYINRITNEATKMLHERFASDVVAEKHISLFGSLINEYQK